MTQSITEIVYERVKSDRDMLERKEFPKIEVDSFNLSDFWNQFGTAVQSLSNEVTKVGFMCGKKPYPKPGELEVVLQEVMQYYNLMKELYMVLPEEVGATVYEGVTSALHGIMSALLPIVRSLDVLSEQKAKERLILIGTFWDACNAVEAVPKTNLSATLKIIEEEAALAGDARDELNTTIQEDKLNMSEVADIDNSDLWTNPERDLASKALGLVKASHMCLKRLLKTVQEFGSCSSPQHIKQLDETVQVVRTVSPALDDFVSELYHPIDVSKAIENAGKLAAVLRTLLFTAKEAHFSEGISKDLNKILLFISHNYSKLDPSADNPLSELSTLTLNS